MIMLPLTNQEALSLNILIQVFLSASEGKTTLFIENIRGIDAKNILPSLEEATKYPKEYMND